MEEPKEATKKEASASEDENNNIDEEEQEEEAEEEEEEEDDEEAEDEEEEEEESKAEGSEESDAELSDNASSTEEEKQKKTNTEKKKTDAKSGGKPVKPNATPDASKPKKQKPAESEEEKEANPTKKQKVFKKTEAAAKHQRKARSQARSQSRFSRLPCNPVRVTKRIMKLFICFVHVYSLEEKEEATNQKDEKSKKKQEKFAAKRERAKATKEAEKESEAPKKNAKDPKDKESKEKKASKEKDENPKRKVAAKEDKEDKEAKQEERTEAEEKEETGKQKKKKPQDEEEPEQEQEQEDEEAKKLQAAEGQGLPKYNSVSHHKEWLRYGRWLNNPKRFPSQLSAKVQSEAGRLSLFQDYITQKGDASAIVARHEQSLEEKNKSKVRYGFRGAKWLQDIHGDTKASKIMARKKSLSLTIPDPEDPDDVLYFVLVDIDVLNINELKRVTSIEIAGQMDNDLLKAFTEAHPSSFCAADALFFLCLSVCLSVCLSLPISQLSVAGWRNPGPESYESWGFGYKFRND